MALVRHRDFGGPSWLWSALDLRARQVAKGIRPAVLEGLSGFRLEIYEGFHSMWNQQAVDDETCADLYPACYNAALAWSDQSPSSLKWLLEALICTNEPDVEIADAVGEPPAVVRAYRELFFDLSRGRDKPFWMQRYVWGPASNCADSVYYQNFVYKMVGFNGGLELLESLFSASITDPAARQWFVDFVMSERMRKTLQFSANYSSLDMQGRSAVMESVVSDWAKLRDVNSGEDEDMMPVMRRLADAVAGSMAVIGLEDRLPAKEIIAVDMYTDEEIKNE